MLVARKFCRAHCASLAGVDVAMRALVNAWLRQIQMVNAIKIHEISDGKWKER